MQAQEIKFLDLLGRPNSQFIVPIFQRVYSWNKRQCEELANDVLAAATSGTDHFLGTFLYTQEADSWNGYERLQIVDGQQRMTTVTLMVLALVRYLRDHDSTLDDGINAHDLSNGFLYTDDETSAKLLLTSIDRDMLEYLIGLAPEPEDTASRLQDCLAYFESRITSRNIDPNLFWRGLKKLLVISIELSGEDSPQLVFESLNSKGKRLAIDDLVRNTLLMHTRQNTAHVGLYRDSWEPMENAVEEIDTVEMNSIILCWLADQHRDTHVSSEDEIYSLFRESLATRYNGSYEMLLTNLKTYCFSLLSNEHKRADAMKQMERWRAGKPKKIISELKLFGD